MAESTDMILPLLREMRNESAAMHERTQVLLAALDKRLGGVENAQASYRNALPADTLMSRLLTGEFDERIGAPEQKVRIMEGRS